MINVQIIDDHKMLAEGLRRIIDESGIATVTAVYYDLANARKGLLVSRPDVLVLDVSFPNGNGIDFCAEIKHAYPKLKVMMLTGYNEFSIVKRSMKNGAIGYVLKNTTSKEILDCIETVNKGEIFLSKEIDILLNKQPDDTIVWCTAREKEVLKLLAAGLSDPAISEKLFVSRETVKNHRKNLLLKFNARNNVALVKTAIEQCQI
jgi:DNA-binding NarL/FixJ family response regulator